MEIPPVVKTVEEIVENLNRLNHGVWIPLDGNYAISKPEILGREINFLSAKEGVILKAFLNTNTAELKFFVAKYLDIPNRENLF